MATVFRPRLPRGVRLQRLWFGIPGREQRHALAAATVAARTRSCLGSRSRVTAHLVAMHQHDGARRTHIQEARLIELEVMDKGRARIEPPDLSEMGGQKDGQPQRSDTRLFMQLMAFGGCVDVAAVARHLESSGVEGVVYEDINDPMGIAILTFSQDPNVF